MHGLAGNAETLSAPEALSALRALLADERDWIAGLANAAALLGPALGNLNWLGCYRHEDRSGDLVLGPFWGRPACSRIASGRGVCGHAAASRQTVVVPDVAAFPGHIACDHRSRSECVIPLLAGDRLLGVLDADAPILNRFDGATVNLLEAAAQILVEGLDWP